MERNEEIKQALYRYVKNRGVSGNYIVDVERDAAFIAGALYADQHPDLSSLWHDASEEPKEDMDILFISKNGKVNKVSKIDQTLYDWLKDNDGIDKWAYISDLLPKGGEK